VESCLRPTKLTQVGKLARRKRLRSKGQGSPSTHEAIALPADEIFLARGEGPGDDVSDWLLAEQESV
jgi:hypothetical protein